jgi:dolichyl-diphosphooligosaccharide--protein glycosyltransferase/undecaprenyl-diphosphooligosaccharide--protein glycosyltransferase
LAKKYIYPIVGISILIYLSSGAFNSILSSLNLYIIKRLFPSEPTQAVASQLHFYGVINTVREAGAIPFETFANRISGSVITFILSSIGVVIMMIKRPVMLISIPMVAMGFMAYKAGLRFTVYAVPIYALGFGYFLFFIADYIKFSSDKESAKKARAIFIAIATIIAIVPNITHIVGYKVPTVLNKMEVNDLVKLSKISSKDDYTLSWWDYGYPIRYYSNTKTIIDGGKHQNDNFIVSQIMFSNSPQQVANLSRLAVETYVKKHSTIANQIFNTKDKNPNLLLKNLEKKDFPLPPKTRDIYLYMPYRMMSIFPTVGVFSNRDLMSGRKLRQSIFYPARAITQKGSKIFMANGVVFDMGSGTVKLGRGLYKVYRFDIVTYGKGGKVQHKSELKHIDGNLCVVFMKSYGNFIVMDRTTYQSAYVQMFILGKYDKNLFELVVSSPYSKIYKLKK